MNTVPLLKSFAAAAVLTISTASFAVTAPVVNTTTTDLGSLTSTGTSFKDVFFGNSFNAIYNFDLSSDSAVGGAVFDLGITSLAVSVDGGASTAVDFYGFTFGVLSAGSHYFTLSGDVTNTIGAYLGAVKAIPAIPPVPEPETFAMLLAGLGVMGAIARRRKV